MLLQHTPGADTARLEALRDRQGAGRTPRPASRGRLPRRRPPYPLETGEQPVNEIEITNLAAPPAPAADQGFPPPIAAPAGLPTPPGTGRDFRRAAPYHFVPVSGAAALTAGPVFHDKLDLAQYATGELRCTLTALTPLLAA